MKNQNNDCHVHKDIHTTHRRWCNCDKLSSIWCCLTIFVLFTKLRTPEFCFRAITSFQDVIWHEDFRMMGIDAIFLKGKCLCIRILRLPTNALTSSTFYKYISCTDFTNLFVTLKQIGINYCLHQGQVLLIEVYHIFFLLSP